MEIYMVRGVITCDGKNYTSRSYYDTLEHAQQYVEESGSHQLDDYGGIYRMKPRSNGEFEIFECIETW